MLKKIPLICLIFMSCFYMTACTPYRNLEKNFQDGTVVIPAAQFDETELGKKVKVGSVEVAQESGCRLMQRYKITTNQNFSASLNLIKYRAALLGAERIAVINHEELDAKEEKFTRKMINDVAVKEGTVLNGADYQSTIIADLFDCSCPTCGCTADDPEKSKASGGVNICSPKK